jgi:hypothetical protein
VWAPTNTAERDSANIQSFLPPSSKWHNAPLDNCKSDALNAIEPQILDEARRVARNPAMLAQTPAGRPDTLDPNLRMVVAKQGNTDVNLFYGDVSFVKGMARPGRRVVGFNTTSGFVNCEGHPVR